MNRRAIHYTTTVILEKKNVGGIFTLDVRAVKTGYVGEVIG